MNKLLNLGGIMITHLMFIQCSSESKNISKPQPVFVEVIPRNKHFNSLILGEIQTTNYFLSQKWKSTSSKMVQLLEFRTEIIADPALEKKLLSTPLNQLKLNQNPENCCEFYSKSGNVIRVEKYTNLDGPTLYPGSITVRDDTIFLLNTKEFQFEAECDYQRGMKCRTCKESYIIKVTQNRNYILR